MTLWALASLGEEILPRLQRRLLSEAAAQADSFSPQVRKGELHVSRLR